MSKTSIYFSKPQPNFFIQHLSNGSDIEWVMAPITTENELLHFYLLKCNYGDVLPSSGVCVWTKVVDQSAVFLSAA